MATAQRGSVELLKQHPLREADLKALHKALSEDEVEILHRFPRPLSTLALSGGSVQLDSVQSRTGRERPAIGWGGRCHREQ